MYPGRKRKNLDFRKVEKQKHRQETARRRGKSILLLLPLVLLVVYLQNYIYYMEKTDGMEKQILEAQSYLNNRGVIEQETRLDSLQSNLELLGRYEEEITSLREERKEQASLTAETLNHVEVLMEGRLEMVRDSNFPIRYEDGVLEFTVRTEKPVEASEYMERLEEAEAFEGVEYYGFERRKRDEEGEDWVYQFDVTCRLALPEREGGAG